MKRFIAVIGILLITACASTPPANISAESGAQSMTASWYGEKFHGRPTASGERYDMHGLTAAHKTLKFGTMLKVTNPDTEKSVVVTVNDRGPFIRGRDLDLSYGAAKEIGLVEKGVGKIRVEYVRRDTRYARRMPFTPAETAESMTIQVGSFIEKERAIRLKQGLEYKYDNVYLTNVKVEGTTYFRVRIGEFDIYDDAYSVAEKLSDEGYSTLIMKSD